MRRFVDLAVGALIIGADDERHESGVQLRERQSGRACDLAFDQMARQAGQQLRIDGSEEALDLAAPLRSGDGRMDQFDPQRRRDLFEVVAGEVAPVVNVKNVRNPLDRPRGIRLRQIACRRAKAVCSDDGAPRNYMNPAMARE